MKSLIILFTFSVVGSSVLAQTSAEDAVRATLQTHPLVKAANFEQLAKKYGEKAALNLPNPELNAESPTGEFYAVGIQQAFEFPTVYARRKQVAKAATALAQAGKQVSENDVRYTARLMYLEAQAADYLQQQWQQRDSLYQKIAASAARQFAAGEIDFLQKTMAEAEAGKVRQEWLAAELAATLSHQQLAGFIGSSDVGPILPLYANTLETAFTPDLANNPAMTYQSMAVQLAEQQLKLAKSRALPSFSLGYLNQGLRNTPIDYRFRASVGIPLWIGQYRAEAQAARSDNQAAMAQAEAQKLAIAQEFQRYQTKAAVALNQVKYYQLEALPRSRSLIEAATRMREAGQIDYITFLRTLNEAYTLQQEYSEQVVLLNTAQIQLQYMAGQ